MLLQRKDILSKWHSIIKYMTLAQNLWRAWDLAMRMGEPAYLCTDIWVKWKVKVVQSCPTLCDPMDYTVHGILPARILEWVAVPFSRGSSQPRDWIQVSHIAGGFFTSWATWESGYQIRTVFRARSKFKRMMCYFKTSVMGIPWWSSGYSFVLSLLRERIQSLVRELSSCKLQCAARNSSNKN